MNKSILNNEQRINRTENVPNIRQVPIKLQLRYFLNRQIESFKPDIIVVTERKGTAIIRALIEDGDNSLKWSWENVYSSAILDELPTKLFNGKRILLFDDMVRTGTQINRTVDRIRKRLISNNKNTKLSLALFAMHESASESIEFIRVDNVAWFYRSVSTDSYVILRQKIIRMLQNSGSLMLDSEHIEIRFRLRGSLNLLIGALQRTADAVVFPSSQNRTNITVDYGNHPLPKEALTRLPSGVGLSGIVKKCRIVQRIGSEFSIIPIFIPSVPENTSRWPEQPEFRELLGDWPSRSWLTNFYSVALIGSLYPLEWILKDLFVDNSQLIDISLPQANSSNVSESAYSLEHLRAIYPNLNLTKLVELIYKISKGALSFGKRAKSLKKRVQGKRLKLPSAEAERFSLSLLQVIQHVLDDRRGKQGEYGCLNLDYPNGLRASEIFDVGKRFDWNVPLISALFDILIDNGLLVTKVESIIDEEGTKRLARTFAPAGETVGDFLRRYSIRRGLPSGF